MRERTCAPNPNLLESMRSVGYDLNTAIADIIDNSIAANATKISILHFGQGEEVGGCGHFLGDRTERFSYVQS